MLASLQASGCSPSSSLGLGTGSRLMGKIPVLRSLACKMLLPQFHIGASYSSCLLLKFNFIVLPNDLAAKATEEGEERRLMQ